MVNPEGRFINQYSTEYPNVPLYLRVSEYIVWAGALVEEAREERIAGIRLRGDDLGRNIRKPPKGPPWQDHEFKYLVAHYSSATQKEILSNLKGRSWNAIKKKAYFSGIAGKTARKGRKEWTPGELIILRNEYESNRASWEELSKKLGRSVNAIRVQAAKRGISSKTEKL